MSRILDYIRSQYLAIAGLIIALAGLYVAVVTYRTQEAFIKIQGENIRMEFTRDTMTRSSNIEFVMGNLINSKWYVTIHNSSIQTPVSIVGYELYRIDVDPAFKVTGGGYALRDLSPFSL